MEKEAQSEAYTTVSVKDFGPAHSEVYVSEPPPAYKKPKTTSVQIAKIVAYTIIVLTITCGLFHLASVYIQSNAIHRLQQLQNRHEQRLNQIPKAEPLIQQNDSNEHTKLLESTESKRHVRRDYLENNKLDESEEDNSLETDDQDASSNPDSKETLNVKFPIQLDLDDLPEELFAALSHNKNSNENEKNRIGNQKSRMNCIVEKKLAEKMINHEPKNIQLPFGVNLTTDKGYEHMSGEKVVILCETGNEQQPQQQSHHKFIEPQNMQPPPVPRQELANFYPSRFQYPGMMPPQQPMEPIMAQQPLRQPTIYNQPHQIILPIPMMNREQEQLQQSSPTFFPFAPPHLMRSHRPSLMPQAIRMPPQVQPQPQPQQTIYITRERIPFPIPMNKPAVVPLTRVLNKGIADEESPMERTVPSNSVKTQVIPPIMKAIAEEIIRDHIESLRREHASAAAAVAEARARAEEQEEKPEVENEMNRDSMSRNIPIPENLLTEINRLPNSEMIVSITANHENSMGPETIHMIPKEHQQQQRQEEDSEESDKQQIQNERDFEPEMDHETKPEGSSAEQETEQKISAFFAHQQQQASNNGQPEEEQQEFKPEEKGEQEEQKQMEPEQQEVQSMEHQRHEEQQQMKKDHQETQDQSNDSKVDEKQDENTMDKKETTTPLMPMLKEEQVSTSTVSVNTANIREARNLQPIQIPVQMIPKEAVHIEERPHYVHPRSV